MSSEVPVVDAEKQYRDTESRKSLSLDQFEVEPVDNDDEHENLGTTDPFPQDPDAVEEQQFTFRAVFVGCLLGAIVSASK